MATQELTKIAKNWKEEGLKVINKKYDIDKEITEMDWFLKALKINLNSSPLSHSFSYFSLDDLLIFLFDEREKDEKIS